MLGELIPCGGGDPIPLLSEELLVGRRSRCDITLQFPNVSSHHCKLELINGFWRIRDLGSRNGIKVNGKRCDMRWLMPKDIVSIAKHKYEVMYEPDGSTPPPQEDDNPFAMGLLEKAGLESHAPEHRKKKQETQQKNGTPPKSVTSPQLTSPPQAKSDIDDDVLGWLNEDDSA